jgi:glycosyltransferase involved in cell wall biosynthesis
LTGPWRSGVAVVNLPVRPAELTHPGVRPSLLLRDAGFEVHAVVRGTRAEREELDGATVWIEPGTAATLRRMAALRPELLFVESGTYGAILGGLGRRSWIRNPRCASSSQVHRLQRAALRLFDAVSFTNHAERRLWKVAPQQVADLPYPVDVSWWRRRVERREAWWTDRGWSTPAGPVLVCNSAFERHKRHRELLDALAPLLAADRSITLVLFGHRWMEPEIWEMVNTRPAALGIAEQVRVTDWISYSEIRDLLAWATLTIINSSRETQCLAIYEALAAGVPTLISAIPELVSQFPTLPAHASEWQLRSNVDQILAEPALGRSLLDSSREQVEQADVRRHDEVFHARLRRLLGRPLSAI